MTDPDNPATGTVLPPPPPGLWAIARKVDPGTTLKSAWKRLLFVGRSLRARPASTAGYAWLASPAMSGLADLNPALYKKITRPYLTPGWSVERMVQVLREHYGYLISRIGVANIRRIFTPPGLVLLQTAEGGKALYEIRLDVDSRHNKEGELTLCLVALESGVRICNLTFLIHHRPEGGHRLMIGGLQGPIEGTDHNWLKVATKVYHGLRPKSLLLFVAQEIAHAWEVAELAGISNALHITQHSDYRFNRTRSPELGYDEFWRECGGTPGPDGFFLLPSRHTPRPMEDIKPNKRSLYRQRYALLEKMRLELAAVLAALRPPLA